MRVILAVLMVIGLAAAANATVWKLDSSDGTSAWFKMYDDGTLKGVTLEQRKSDKTALQASLAERQYQDGLAQTALQAQIDDADNDIQAMEVDGAVYQ